LLTSWGESSDSGHKFTGKYPSTHGTSGIYALPDDGVVDSVHARHGLFIKGQNKVSFFLEALATSKGEMYAARYAESHVVSKGKRETVRKLRLCSWTCGWFQGRKAIQQTFVYCKVNF